MQSRLMLKRMLVFLAVYGALSLYWIHTYDSHFFGLDELNVFVSFEKATDPEELIKTLFAPHNRHFAPVFKTFFYLEYLLFGPSPAPYHSVSIALYTISALLLWRFLLIETGDRMTAFLCTALYAANSTYFTVVAWVFIQQFVVTLIFIELSLISVQKNGGARSFIASGICCILASFCMAMGALAWFFTAAYYGARYFTRAGKPHIWELIKRLMPVWGSAVITFASYLLVREGLAEDSVSTMVTDPLVIAKGIAVVIGNNIVRALGFFHVINQRVPYEVLEPVMNFFMIMLFVLAMLAAFLLLKKLGKAQRATALTGISLSWLTAAIVISASVGYFQIDVFYIVNYSRYNYFPFFFLLIGLAPFLAALGRGPKVKLLLILPIWMFLHYYIYTDLITLNNSRVERIRSSLSFVERSVKGNYPLIKEPSGNIVVIDMPMTKPRPLKDVIFFKNVRPSYKDLLHLYKGPGDIVVEYPAMVLFLRRQMPVSLDAFSATPGAALKVSDGRLEISSPSEVALTAGDIAVPRPSRFQHLSFRLKAGAAENGAIVCRSKKGAKERTRFEVKDSWAHKLYVLPCLSGDEVSFSFGPGDYSIKDMSFHY
jgi:hypothetical protein